MSHPLPYVFYYIVKTIAPGKVLFLTEKYWYFPYFSMRTYVVVLIGVHMLQVKSFILCGVSPTPISGLKVKVIYLEILF